MRLFIADIVPWLCVHMPSASLLIKKRKDIVQNYDNSKLKAAAFNTPVILLKVQRFHCGKKDLAVQTEQKILCCWPPIG